MEALVIGSGVFVLFGIILMIYDYIARKKQKMSEQK